MKFPSSLLSSTSIKQGTKYVVNVLVERCKECGLCINVCPKGVLVKGEEYNSRGYRYVVPKNIDNCIGCKLCEYICPDIAIFVVRGVGYED
jgi:2-oxoglutarate ferredoxin oxidoreductase subunit delta